MQTSTNLTGAVRKNSSDAFASAAALLAWEGLEPPTILQLRDLLAKGKNT
jgi:membrane-bound lytic murein transglycosylase B